MGKIERVSLSGMQLTLLLFLYPQPDKQGRRGCLQNKSQKKKKSEEIHLIRKQWNNCGE
jgi:hypothetical protein